MNLAGWRFLLFALLGAGAIVLLASIGTPGAGERGVDRYTGERVIVVRTVADALAEARATGNVVLALEKVRGRLESFPDEEPLERLAALLTAELAGALAPGPPHHPEAEVLRAEQQRVKEHRAELERRGPEMLNPESLLGLLAALEADSAVARAVEDFFAPLARWRQEHPESAARPDELAARTLARLDEEGATGAGPFLRVAATFRAANRPRARTRWLLRAFGAAPRQKEVREQLVQVYLEQGRVLEAFHVVGCALGETPVDRELWNLRARMAGWLSLPEAEIQAREELLKGGEDRALRERLLELYVAAGRPEGAVPHAAVLAEGSADPAVLERPAQLALRGGLVDEALEILERLAASSDDPAPWREKIVAIAWQDLRMDRVARELQILRRLHPDRDYGERLESLYRRTDNREALLALLEERFAAGEGGVALETELVNLHAALGNRERVREILIERISRIEDPREFFETLDGYRAMRIEGLEELIPRMASLPGLRIDDVPFILDQMKPYLADPLYREAARNLSHRFPLQPASVEMLLYLVDREPTDADRARAAAELAKRYPTEPAYLKAWIERAAWAGDNEAELAGREAWEEHNPDDAENRRRLAFLYVAVSRPGEAVDHWLVLAEREGPGSEAALHLVEALFAADRLEEAMDWLERRASLPDTTLEEHLHVADQLYGSGRADRALRFYMAVLDEDPGHAKALLRAGQIRSWTNDPRGAIPFFLRRLAATEEERAEVRYYLGEAYWAIHEDAEAARAHRLALEDLQAMAAPSLEQEVMLARILVRFGRVAEARPVFERVIAQAPDNPDLILDYADAMASTSDVAKARELVERARGLGPYRARTMHLDGKVLILEGRYREADAVLADTIRRHGADAAVEADLGRARELAGDYRPAAEAYRRSLALQPENGDLARSLQRVLDQAADFVHGRLSYRRAAKDDVLELWAGGSALLRDGRTRLAAAAGVSEYTGRAGAVDAGATDVTATVAHLQLAAFGRFLDRGTVGGGLMVYGGAEGDVPVGGWAGAMVADAAPYRMLAARVHGHLLLEEPAAAPGLGGRTSGIRIEGLHDVGRRGWVSAELAYEILSAEPPGQGRVQDGRVSGAATFGWRLIQGDAAVPDLIRLDTVLLPGLVGTHLAEDSRKQASVWVTYQAIRLLDGADLEPVLPVGGDFDYLLLGARGDFPLAPGLGAKLEGYGGVELGASEPLFGLEAGVAWRPSHRAELSATAGYGSALGRESGDDSFLLRVGATVRW